MTESPITDLKINRKFYTVYPQFGKAIKTILEENTIGQSLTDQLHFSDTIYPIFSENSKEMRTV